MLPGPTVFCMFCRQTLFSLDTPRLHLLAASGAVLAVGGLAACYCVTQRKAKTLPMGDGWWGVGPKPLSEDESIYPFLVKISEDEIQVRDCL